MLKVPFDKTIFISTAEKAIVLIILNVLKKTTRTD